jgi:hypothetical protein
LRKTEGEGTAVVPVAVRVSPIRAEPATPVAAVGVEEARAAVSLDGLVDTNDPPDTHSFELLVREVFPDEAHGFGLEFNPTTRRALGFDVLGQTLGVLPERPANGGDLVDHTCSRNKIVGIEDRFRSVGEPLALRLETLLPLLAGPTVRCGEREVNHTVPLRPLLTFGNRRYFRGNDSGTTAVCEERRETFARTDWIFRDRDLEHLGIDEIPVDVRAEGQESLNCRFAADCSFTHGELSTFVFWLTCFALCVAS